MPADEFRPPAERLHRELRRQRAGAVLMVVGALALAAVLVPRGDELLLIYVRNRDIARAQGVLTDRVAQGVSTVSSVVAHGELFLMEGRVDEALADLEGFVKTDPDNLAAWKRLVRLYGNAQRLQDQIRATAQVHRLAPSPDTARQLAMFYRWIGDDAREAATLHELVRMQAALPDDYARAARLEATLGQPGAALERLEALRAANAEAFDYPLVELYASLTVDRDGPARLAERIQALPAVVREPALLQQLSAAFHGWGRQDAALAVLDVPPGAVASPSLLTMRAVAAVGTPAARAVADDLLARDAAAPLQGDTLAAVVDLALSVGDYAGIERLLARPGRTPAPRVLATVIGYAVSHDARPEAQAMLARFGDEALAEAPLLALELAAERGDDLRARQWIRRIDEAGTASPDELTAVANIEAAMGMSDEAFARLERVVMSGGAPAWAYRSFADLATDTADRERALETLGMQAPRASDARRAWVGVAAALGRLDVIEQWVASPGVTNADAEALHDAVTLLSDRGDHRRSLAAASRLVAVRGHADDHLLLGTTLLAADRPGAALEALRHADPSRPVVQPHFEAALARTLLSGVDVAAEVRSVFAPRLAGGDLPAERRALLVEGLLAAGERAAVAGAVLDLARADLDRWLSPLVETARAAGQLAPATALVAGALADTHDSGRTELLVRALMELDAPGAVLLPYMRTFALERRDSWAFAYDERLAREGLVDARVELWTSIGTSTEAPAAERRTAASRLVELGAPAAASSVLLALAGTAGPADPDVQQLMWLWGSPAPEDALRWLQSRLQTAPVTEQPGWMAHLTNAGGAHLVRAAIPVPPADGGPGFLRAWVDAHRGAGPEVLRGGLAAVLDLPAADLDTVRYVGTTGLAEGFVDVAERAFARVLPSVPDDLEALRWAGTLAFYRGDTIASFERLSAYEHYGGREAEPLFQLGELWLARRDTDRARTLYERALAALEAPATADTNAVLHANVLVRLGERSRAAAVFEAVLREDPTHRHARADYASALLQWGRSDDAGRVLAAREPGADARDRDGSGTRRLDLLRVQWLNGAGRFGAALAQVDALGSRYPNDADVLVARAGIDTARGRLADADRAMQAARRQAPARSDIAEAVAVLAREREPRASVSAETRSIGPWTSTSQTLALTSGPRQPRAAALTLERQTVTAPQVLRTDGSVTALATELTRVEGSITTFAHRGTELRASVFGAASGLGGGATLVRHDLRGGWTVAGETNRPFWDFVESAADGGRKDRLSVQREWRFRPDMAAWAVADWNRYRLGSGADAVSNAFTLGFIRTVRPASPTVTLQYGLDTERVRRQTRVTTAEGLTFTPVPLTSREVHLFGVVSRSQLGAIGELDASGGYTVDRLGGRGSFLTAHLTPRPAARVGLELWGERRLFQMATTQRALRVGARGVVRF